MPFFVVIIMVCTPLCVCFMSTQQVPPPPVVIPDARMYRPVGEPILILSIIMIFFSLFCGCGLLLCIIPAVLIAASVRHAHLAAIIKLLIARTPLPQACDDDRRGDHVSARSKGRIALALILAALVIGITVNIIVIVIVVLAATHNL